ELLHAVAEQNIEKARRVAKSMRGPSGKMLRAGADHLGAPRELIEEVMYEKVLKTKLKVQRALPFIAICAAAAPLLGLLGTVSGIINTFKMMQISGGSDMQNVSGGISEALITTKYGLIVAIPALILHVFLSRMARSVIDKMEKSGVAFINQVMKASPGGGERAAEPPEPSPDEDSPSDQPEPSKKTHDSVEEGSKQVAEDAEQLAVEKPAEGEQKPELVETGTE
nr:MotA/TolQ/ExbB proton channel family protein [Phycisphaeraceae bacterium]